MFLYRRACSLRFIADWERQQLESEEQMDNLKYFANSSVKKARCSTYTLHKAKFSVSDNDSSPKDTLWGHLGWWTTEWKNNHFGRSLCQSHSSSYIKGLLFFLAQHTWRYFIVGGNIYSTNRKADWVCPDRTNTKVTWKGFLAGHMLCGFPEIEQTHHQVVAAAAGRANVNTSVTCFISQVCATCCTLAAYSHCLLTCTGIYSQN